MLEEALAALGLPTDATVAPASGGASESAWLVRAGAERFVLRRASSSSLTDARLAAMAAAREAGLPAPELIGRARTGVDEVVLLSWMPGESLHEVIGRATADARRWGARMGELQRRLHDVVAPSGALRVEDDPHRPFVAGRDVAGLPRGDRLLHLDWHPLNLLVDGARGEISGIVDWDNARAGHPLLDLARTRGILTREPSLALLPRAMRSALGPLIDGWVDGYGVEARDIPPACELWAVRVMLADLQPRYRDRPAALDPLRARLADLNAVVTRRLPSLHEPADADR